MKQILRLPNARASAVALGFILCAAVFAEAQTPSATPDAFVAQITNVTTSGRNAFANGISGDGRLVVIESTADLTSSGVNTDGNREIFLFDYAQRRIFQITNTRSALVDPTKPAVDESKTPDDYSNTVVEVSNNRAVISYDGKWIVFSSNAYVDSDPAATPKNFNGSDFRDALRADGNQEIFLYRIPDLPAADLSSGAEVAPIDLSSGTVTRVTNTLNTLKPQPGTTTTAPTVVDDNRSATLNDDGSLVAFISSRNITGANADLNAEVFLYGRLGGNFNQVTNTTNPPNTFVNLIWNANPWLSADGSRMSFISSADEQIPNAGPIEPDTTKGNGEVYLANLSGTSVASFTRVTRTQPIVGDSTTVLSPGARISRNGSGILFESKADIQSNGSVNGAPKNVAAIYLYSVGDNSFKLIADRPVINTAADLPNADIPLRFPTFTGDGSTAVFASSLNFQTNGQISTSTTEGLNPTRRVQIFGVPVAGAISVTRLTSNPTGTASTTGLQPLVGNTVSRIAFTYSGAELGGGNADFSPEVFYLLVPAATSDTANAPLSYTTGASNRPVAAPSPSPTPTGDFVPAVAPGMLATARATAVNLAPSPREVNRSNAQENQRRPPLPFELNGVSVSFNGAAAGLYLVAPGQINFVVPLGLPAGTYNVVVNNNGAVLRSSLAVAAAQPDIATTTNSAGGRAMVLNVTNPLAPTPEPFSVTTTRPKADGTGPETVATELSIMLTGVRTVQRTGVTVRIGTTDLTGDAIVSVGPSNTAGFDQIVVRLPATLAAGDVPVIVTAGSASSRPEDTAPRIRIGEATNPTNDVTARLVWQREADGQIGEWLMNGTTLLQAPLFTPAQVADTSWKIRGVGDFNSDGQRDLVWQREADGQIGVWLMNGTTLAQAVLFSPAQVADTSWRIAAVADFNNDSRPDLVWQNEASGQIGVWLMNGTTLTQVVFFTPGQVADTSWKIRGVGDFNADGQRDLVWQREADGQIGVWLMNGTTLVQSVLFTPSQVSDLNWKIRGIGDFNADGKPDLVWQREADGQIGAWLMNGTTLVQSVLFTPNQVADTSWRIRGVQ